MTLSTRAIVLACLAMLIVSATVTFAVERYRSGRPARTAPPVTQTPPAPRPRRISCDSLLRARNATLGQTFDVPASGVYTGPPAEVVFRGQPEALYFRTRIRQAMLSGPNFGGRYVVASWDCGNQCQRHAIVDAGNGAIVSFGLETDAGLEYLLRSRLLVTNPKKNIATDDDSDLSPLELALKYTRIPRVYYEIVEATGGGYLNRLCVENAFEGDTF